MARQIVTAQSPLIDTTVAARTLLQVAAAANHAAVVRRWGISFGGNVAQATGVRVRLMRQTTAGVMSSLTVSKHLTGFDDTVQLSASHTATTEPTYSDELRGVNVHPMSGEFSEVLDDLEQFVIEGSERVGIVVLATAAVNAYAWMQLEE